MLCRVTIHTYVSFYQLMSLQVLFLREAASLNAWLIVWWKSDKLNIRKRRTFQHTNKELAGMISMRLIERTNCFLAVPVEM